MEKKTMSLAVSKYI